MEKKFYTFNDFTTLELTEAEKDEKCKSHNTYVIYEVDKVSWLSEFVYQFSTGDIIKMPYYIADLYCDINKCKVEKYWREKVYLGIHGGNFSNQVGWNQALGMYISSPRQYKEELRKRGLEEVGNEDMSKYTPKHEFKPITDDVIKTAVDMGANISGSEATALKDGKNLHD